MDNLAKSFGGGRESWRCKRESRGIVAHLVLVSAKWVLLDLPWVVDCFFGTGILDWALAILILVK